MSVTFELELLSIFGDDVECIEMVKDVRQKHAEFLVVYERKKNEKIESEESLRQALVVEWRREKDINRELDAEQGSLLIENANIDNAVKNSHRNLREYRRDYAPDKVFSLPSDLKRFNSQVAALEDAHEEAKAAQTEYNGRVGSWKSRKAVQNKKVQELEDEIGRCWRIVQRLQGNRVPVEYSRETGLPIVDIPVEMQPVGEIPKNKVVHKTIVPGAVSLYSTTDEDEGQMQEKQPVGVIPLGTVIHK